MNKSRIKILFILPSLKAGGAERVISTIASGLNPAKYKSTLLVIGKAKDAVYNTEGVEVHFLNKSRVLVAIPKLFQFILTNKPNIIVGSISHVNKVLSIFKMLLPNTKCIGREASVGSIMSKYADKKRIRFNLYKNYFKNLDALICQSKDMADDIITNYQIDKHKIHIINNPISDSLQLKKSIINQPKQLITVGRLSKEKGHKRILSVLSKLTIPFEYTIIGNGNEKENIIELSKILNIDKHIRFISYTDNVGKYLSESDLFLQGSYVEGFPNALLESIVVGTPAITYIAPGGTKEIIIDNVNGFIANTEEDYLKHIEIALSKNWNPSNIRASVINKFNKQIILKQYETLFEGIV